MNKGLKAKTVENLKNWNIGTFEKEHVYDVRCLFCSNFWLIIVIWTKYKILFQISEGLLIFSPSKPVLFEVCFQFLLIGNHEFHEIYEIVGNWLVITWMTGYYYSDMGFLFLRPAMQNLWLFVFLFNFDVLFILFVGQGLAGLS